jgi:Fic/DOC family protein
MNFFKKSDWVELNAKDFDKLIAKLPEYRSLVSTIGIPHAQGTTLALWNKFGGFSGKFQYRSDNEKGTKQMLGALLRHEQNCVLQAHYYIGNLAIQARTGKFRSEFSGETMAPADYGSKSTDNNLEKATRYLIHTSNSLKNTADTPGAPITASAIKSVIQNAAMYDVRSEVTLRDLHRRCVDQAQLRPTRATDLQVGYPSTGGAGFLLEATFKFARGIALPANGDARWFDLACFLLGAVIRSHGFTDGNGRVGRAAFAAALVKGGLPFAPLKVGAEKLLHGLDKVS